MHPTQPRHTRACLILAAICCSTTTLADEYRVWEPVTIDVHGPRLSESGDVNPFRDMRMIVTFSQGGMQRRVHGYFAADGNAADSGAEAGDVWRVRFVPDLAGEWRYTVSLRRGDDIALSDDPQSGQPADGDGTTGTIDVGDNPDADGMLQYVGERYLRWSGSGRPWLKCGVDSPENLLGYSDFDGTRKLGDGQLHFYEPHVRDWNKGDPVWGDGRGKGLIGAVNYLASQRVNSMYFIPMNIAGDGKDVWPWTAPDVRDRFDCSKLDQWEIIYSHMDRLGIQLHMILTETENESLFEVERGTASATGGVEQNGKPIVAEAVAPFADTRKLYYRELIARFAHHRAIEWNLGEENGGPDDPDLDAPHRGNSDEQRKAFAAYIRDLDPYDHPIVVHTFPGNKWYQQIYPPLLGDESFEGPSIQIGAPGAIHDVTKEWLRRSAEAGRPWFVCIDEQGPAGTGVKPDADDPQHDQVRRNVLWANLMAGGSGCEWYFGYRYANNDLNCEDFRSREEMYRQTRIATEFFQEHLHFTEMVSADDLLTNDDCWCLARPDDVYAVYLPPGDRTRIRLPEGDFQIRWFNPRAGGELQEGSVAEVEGGNTVSPGEPPGEPDQDWVVLLDRIGGSLCGTIRVRGDVPELPSLVEGGADVRQVECAAKEAPDESFLVSDERGLANVFVYLIQKPRRRDEPAPPERRITISTQDCRFAPHAMVVRAPAGVRFPETSTVHGPRVAGSPSDAIGRAVPNYHFIWELPSAERVPLSVTCDNHAWMQAWVLPLDHPFGAVTDAYGHFEIEGLPPGEYHFRVWHERSGWLEKDLNVHIQRDDVTEISLEYPVERFFGEE